MKRVVVCAAVVALGIAGIGSAQAVSGFKVTGGGQALATADSSSVKGPGDTYGFNAQDIDGDAGNAAKGQFNSIQRDADATVGRGQGEHIKGAVTCLVATTSPDGAQGAARFGGEIRNSAFFDEESDTQDYLVFIVDVTDNGEGKDNADFIQYEAQEYDADNDGDMSNNPGPCDPERTLAESEETILARGNVQVHNAEE